MTLPTMMRAVLAVALLPLAIPAVAATPVSYSCLMDDIYKSQKTWYRHGMLLHQLPIEADNSPPLTEMVIVVDTEEEMVATLAKLDAGVTYEWGITLATGRHWDTTMQDGDVVVRTFGKCVVNY
jgi:hypothetical protein